MKVLTEQVVRFLDGETLAPEDLNALMLYAQDALDDVSEKRWAVAPLTFSFTRTMTTPITQADLLRVRTHRFVCPVTCIVQSAQLDGNLTSTAGFRVDFTDFLTGLPPQGATSPYLQITDAAAAAVDVNDVNVDKVLLTAGRVYELVISATTFSVDRLDVTLNVAVDRFMLGTSSTAPAFSPFLMRDEPPNPSIVLSNTASLTTEASKLSTRGMTPLLVWAAPYTVGADPDLLTFALPRYLSTRAQARIVRAYLTVARSAPANIQGLIKDSGGTTIASVSAAAASLFETVDSGVLNIAINTAASEVTANDYSVSFTIPAANTIQRAAMLIWVQWG